MLSSLHEARRCFGEARDGFVACRQVARAKMARRRLDLIADLLANETPKRAQDSLGFNDTPSEHTTSEPG
jgi:hypothetical protein